MAKKRNNKKTLSIISIIIGIVSLVFAFVGLPGTYDTEPLLAVAVILLALAVMKK